MIFSISLLAALALAPPPASASMPLTPPVQQRRAQQPEAPFRWSMGVEDLGLVAVPAVGTGNWAPGPNGLFYRSVPSFSGDPTYEIRVRAPYSGHPLYAERMMVQIPANFASMPFTKRAVVVGFHSFSVSEKDIFINTSLPQEAQRRGWMLIAPYGLNDTSFGNTQAQASLAAVAHALFSVVPFNYRRIYGVGFSMGGLSALSFAMRHLDPLQLQFAGVVVHTGTLDMVQTFQFSTLSMQLLLANSSHFGGTPLNAAFEYERISPVRFLSSGLVNPDAAPVVNFANRPIYLHSNLADPNTTLLAGMTSLRQFLQQRGANVIEDLVYDPANGHKWGTLDIKSALNFMEQYSLETTPFASQEFQVDNPARWLHTQVDSISPDTCASFRLEIAPAYLNTLNSFSLEDTRDLEEISLDLSTLGLDPKLPLVFTHSSADGTLDWINISGLPLKPKSVKAGGGPPATWNYTPDTGVLSLVPSVSGLLTNVVVVP